MKLIRSFICLLLGHRWTSEAEKRGFDFSGMRSEINADPIGVWDPNDQGPMYCRECVDEEERRRYLDGIRNGW